MQNDNHTDTQPASGEYSVVAFAIMQLKINIVKHLNKQNHIQEQRKLKSDVGS